MWLRSSSEIMMEMTLHETSDYHKAPPLRHYIPIKVQKCWRVKSWKGDAQQMASLQDSYNLQTW